MGYWRDIRDGMLSAFKGMSITIKYLGKKPVTQQFPDERWELPDRFRGFVHNDIARCTACQLCAKDCPVDCIYIEMEGKGKDRKMSRYAIDYNKCIWCSLCTEHCPTHCITMSHDYDHAVYLRESLVYEFVGEPVVPYTPPKPKKPKPPAKKKAETGEDAAAKATPAMANPGPEAPATEKPQKPSGPPTKEPPADEPEANGRQGEGPGGKEPGGKERAAEGPDAQERAA